MKRPGTGEGRRKKKERDGRREEEEGKKRERTWFEAPRQTGQRDLLKSTASVQSIV